MKLHMKRLLESFRTNERGNVAIIFGLSLLPVMGLTGAAVDYTRASQLRGRMAVAADAAVLAAVKASGKTLAERQAIADAVFSGSLGSDSSMVGVSGILTAKEGNAYRYEASANYTHAIIQVLPGIGETTAIGVVSEAQAGAQSIEVALVLDNTGSMNNDMAALRKAGKDFTDILFDSATDGAEVKISIVPYVAAVNPGRLNLGMSAVDTDGSSTWQARRFRFHWVAYIPNCTNDPWHVPGPVGPPGTGPGTPGKGAWLQDGFRKLASVGNELFGIKSASAQVGTYGTPNRKAPFIGYEITIDKPYTATDGVKAFVPNGFGYDPVKGRCVLKNPGKIAHLDLFDGIRTKNGTAQWKGCVEARPEPYDVTDDPPVVGTPNTQFSPYFWLDEPGDKSKPMGYVNSYMDDGVGSSGPAGWNNDWESMRAINLFKYDGLDRNADFSESPPNTGGPNMACPDELLRLSNNRTTIKNKIDSLNHWNGGGTNSSEGIMWGWRTLSPKLPFADAKPYGTSNNKKVLVLMTDGENQIGDNWPSAGQQTLLSHYSAYGYLSWGRFGSANFQVAHDYLDSRMRLACSNAKAAGVQIISILYRVETEKSKELLKSCATNAQMFIMAKNQSELQTAFKKVAEEIKIIRLTK